LLKGDVRLLEVLPGMRCEIRVNAGALAEQGFAFEAGIEAIRRSIRSLSPARLSTELMDRQALRSFRTTWAKRLAFGRDPRAVVFRVNGTGAAGERKPGSKETGLTEEVSLETTYGSR
jgi:hypothetical protein